jgi:hypothetical protein
MEVIDIVENEDGSATMDVNFEKDEVSILLSYAVIDMIKQAIYNEQIKQEGGDETADIDS